MALSSAQTLTRIDKHDEREVDMRPLELGLIRRLFHYTKPYAAKRNWLVLLVVLRSIQLPALTWMIAAIIKGPIASGSIPGVIAGMLGFTVLALSTQVVMHFRQRLALELGESVVFDLRNHMFRHLQTMPMSFYHRTKLGRIISRMTSDVEDVRMGVQEVLFVSLVQIGQMGVAAAFMLWYDPLLFLIVLGLVPMLWVINNHFRLKLSIALRHMRDSFSRVTATLAESVNGIRVTQGFVRQDVNAQMFGDLVRDHAEYNTVVNRTQGLFLPLLDLNNQFFVALLLLVGGYQALHSGSTTHVGDLVGFFLMANMFFSPITVLGNQYNTALTAMAGAERIFNLLDRQPDWQDDPDGHRCSHARRPGRIARPAVRLRSRPAGAARCQFHRRAGSNHRPGRPHRQRQNDDHQPDRQVLSAERRRTADRRPRNSAHHQRFAPSAHRHRFAAEFSVHRHRAGEHPPGPARGDRRRSDRRRRTARLPRSDFRLARGLPNPSRRARRQSLAGAAANCLLCPRDAGRSADSDSRRSHEQRRHRDRSPRAAGAGSAARGRTSFVVAHRLSTIRHADQVLVLDHGRIVERGTHSELFARNGTYTALYRRFSSRAA